jgi:diguanylate cyclase (GGDEF)-like protein/PAS domain S-box-containing protein
MILSLINNIAFLVALVAAGQIVISRFHKNPLNRQMALGLLFGGVALLVMANPVNFLPGVIFDGRSIVLSVAGVVGGAVPAAIAAGVAAVYRYQLGGSGAMVGILVVLLSGLLGVLARKWWLRRASPPQPAQYLALGVVVQLVQLAAFTQVPNRAGYAFIEQAWWVLLLSYPLATMLLCLIFRNHEQQLMDQQALSSARDAATAAETASIERFHAYFDHSVVGLAITSPEKGWIEVNDALCATLGYTREELTRMTWTELTYPEDVAPDLAQFNRMLAGEINSYTLEKRFVHKDSHLVDTRLAVSHVRKPDGSIDYVVAMVDDISERKRAQIASDAVRRQLKATLDALPDLLFEVDAVGRIVSYHSHRSDLLAAPPEVFVGKLMVDFLPPDAASACQHAIDEAAKNGFSNGVTYRLALPQGEHWFELSVAPLHADAQPDQRFIMICRDITDRKRANESLQQAASVFGHTREGIFITDVNGTIVDVNEAFTRITGYNREEAIGQNPRILSSGRQDTEFYRAMWTTMTEQGHWSGEIWNRRKDGEVYAELLTTSAIRDGQGAPRQYVALFTDITAIKAHQSQLEHIAHFDALTNLPNRVLLADRLHQTMAQSQRRHQQLAVVYLDLDGFKFINDHHGHGAGDQMLITLAMRMKEALREGDTLARLGGDEFVAVLTDLENTLASMPLLERLLVAAALPISVGSLSLQVSASLGVTFYPQAQDIDADQLLRQADQAMYQAKVAGKNRYCVFDAAHDSSIRDNHESLERIRLALEKSEFVLYYQPKVNMHSGQVIGAEALIRWQHPEKGLLAPAAFLPLIENHPLAIDVGEWVIDTALHQMEVWRTAGLDLPVSVNIGARQLQQGDFVVRLKAILARHPQVHPGCIELEVLETSALSDMDQVSQVIEDCAAMGVKFSLDDFGTGYSSLTYLKRLRVAVLKIDQSFVRDMLDDPDDLAILQGIIGLAAAFKREVIAEGVETVAHGTALLQLGCELAQGYGIARPMPPDQMPGWAATWQPNSAWGNVSRATDK